MIYVIHINKCKVCVKSGIIGGNDYYLCNVDPKKGRLPYDKAFE
jgi:hypothetical protein